MADSKHQLDAGFEEVPLDHGFEEVPLDHKEHSPASASNDISDLGGGAVPFSEGKNPTVQELKAAGTGLLQGGTLGFSDEIGASADVVGDVLNGKTGPNLTSSITGEDTSLAGKWRKHQKDREAANKALQEESPNAYMAGELGGGVLSSMAVPELGGAKLLGALGKFSPKVAAFLASSTPEAMAIKSALQAGKLAPEAAEAMLAAAPKAGSLAKIAGSATKLGIEGAPLGALYGAGTSEADLSNSPGQLVKDTLSGAAMGSLGGAAIGGAVAVGKEAMGAAGNVAKKYDFTRKLGAAKELGENGVTFDSSEGKDKVASLSKEIPNEIVQQIMTVDGQLGKAVGNALDEAEKAGVRINIDPALKESANETFQIFNENPVLLSTIDPKSRAIITKAASDGLGDLTPLEARALKDTFNDLTEKLAGMNSDVAHIARKRGSNLATALNEQLKKTIPAYKDAAAKFSDFRSKIPETILQPGLPDNLRTKSLGDLKNQRTDLYKASNTLFGKAHMPGGPTVEGPRAGMAELGENLKSLEQSNPEAVKALGGSAEDVMSGWKKKADQMAVLRQSQGVEPHEGLLKSTIGSIVGSGEGLAYNLANKYGNWGKGISDNTKGIATSIGQSTPVKASKQLFNAGDEQLGKLAQSLKLGKSSRPFGEALEKALANKDEIAKNAVLFKLLQIPEYRQMLSHGAENE